MRIAVIGSGISGLTAAYLMNRKHDVTVFEKQNKIGGHTATIDFDLHGNHYAIDTGFIVFNDWTYPNFIKLLDQINVRSQPTSMGFSVSCDDTGLEYAGNNLDTLFAQRKNLLSPRFLRMVSDIVKFNRMAQDDLENDRISESMTLGEYLKRNGYCDAFSRFYLLPMGAAIWSMSCEKMYDFPLKFFVAFFKNHGLLNIKERPTWRVIQGGSKQYLQPLVASFKNNIVLGADIKGITRKDNHVDIHFHSSESQTFDQVIIAAHSDQALALLDDPSEDEKSILGAIAYQKNSVVLHYDESLLPKTRKTWSSWNYKLRSGGSELPTLTYNMNILQGIKDDITFCVTLNDDEHIDSEKIIDRFEYAHPQFTLPGETAKKKWSAINGVRKTWFCGAYWANGFHEDGVVSALRIASEFGIEL